MNVDGHSASSALTGGKELGRAAIDQVGPLGESPS